MINIVLDTNCLIASISKRGNYFNVWRSLHSGLYYLCVSNEILEEYEEILSQKTNPLIASNVIQAILCSPYVKRIDPHYHFHLIQQDKDDNKFVDCAVAANAHFIVSNDGHFEILNTITFPKLNVINLATFSALLKRYDFNDGDSIKEFMVNEEASHYSYRTE